MQTAAATLTMSIYVNPKFDNTAEKKKKKKANAK